MEHDFILLNEIYQNALTAVGAMSQVLSKTVGSELFDCLFEEMGAYREIANTAYDMILKENKRPKKESKADKAAFYISVKLSCGKASTQHRITKTLINGSLEGIYDICSYVNRCTYAKEGARRLAYRLIETEENNIKKLNKYL